MTDDPKKAADDVIRDVVAKQIAAHFEVIVNKELFGQITSNSLATETSFDAEKMLAQWEKDLRNIRRSQVTFVCDVGHEGPILKHETPNDGARIELGWHHLLELHRHHPVQLSKVNSPEQAEFIPASRLFDQFIPRYPEPPPWTVPEPESYEDWLAGRTKQKGE